MSGASIFCSGMDGAGSLAVGDGPAATGCTPPDIGISIAIGVRLRWERERHIPAKTARTKIQTREVLKTYLFIAVSLLSASQGGPKQLRDRRGSLRIRASG